MLMIYFYKINELFITNERVILLVTFSSCVTSLKDLNILLVTRVQASQQSQMKSPKLSCPFNIITYQNSGIQNKDTKICVAKLKRSKRSYTRINFV